MRKLVIGTRGSLLALWQARHIAERLEREQGLESELKIIKTRGDKILDVPLAKIGGKGLFTKELEELLLSGEIDVAVHSLKDVPVILPEGLELVAITERGDVRDCYVSERYPNLEDLPLGARVGTTSLRRTMQLRAHRGDLDTQSLRGNVQTRIQKLQEGGFDAIVLAFAGIKRLGLEDAIPFIKPFGIEAMLPAMGQGALGIECRSDSVFYEILKGLDDPETRLLCGCEREFIRCLDGGCQVPIGVHAVREGEGIRLMAKIGLPDGSRQLQARREFAFGTEEQAREQAMELAGELISQGAKELLVQAIQMMED